MNPLRCLFQQKTIYFAGFFTVLGFAILLVSSNTKINCFIYLNTVHNWWLDIFFINCTFLGDGIFSIIAALLLLFIGKLYRLSFHIVMAFLISGIAAQVLKGLFMAPRPKEIIETGLYRFFLEGISSAGWNSFPSGHTTSIFALATVMALHASKKSQGLFFLIIAVLVGYSRIYLGQHFLEDVIAGAILGTGMGVIVYLYIKLEGGLFKRKSGTGNSVQDEIPYPSSLTGN